MLEVKNIKKNFGEKAVLDDVSVRIENGEVYGLIGANGAGKTTLMNIISNILQKDSGEILLNNSLISNVNDISGKIGYMLDIPSMFEFMTAMEYFEYLSSPTNMTKEQTRDIALKLLSEVGLEKTENKRIKNFSRGMKQRMGIAAALLADPQVVLMDEPSSALDPQGRFEVIQIIEKLKSRGKTIILSTHILNDIERVCDRVGLLVNGKIVIEGNISEIISKYSENAFIVESENEEVINKVIEQVSTEKFYVNSIRKGCTCEIAFKEGKKQEMFSAIAKVSGIDSIYLKTATIEQIFLKASREGKK